MRQAASGQMESIRSPLASDTPEQLLLRFARGRVKHFMHRQSLTAVGALMLAAVGGWQIGLLVACLALLGETVDCLYLRTFEHRLQKGADYRSLARNSMFSGMFQALTISACALISWFATSHHTLLFTAAFIAGAAINAGLILPFHKGASVCRLAIYLATLIAVAFGMIGTRDLNSPELYLDITGLLVLTFMVAAFLDFVVKGTRRNRRNLAFLVQQGAALEQANADLIRSKRETEQLSLVARHANDGVILCNARREVVWVNETFTRITGYTLRDVVGKRPGAALVGPKTDVDILEEMDRQIKAGRPFRGEVQILTRDGRDVWIESNQVPVLDETGALDMIVLVERDITEQKAVAGKLAEAKRQAEEGERAKTEFLATMSHEIRTPMNGVIGMADLISETDLTEEQRLYADCIRSSAGSLLHLINDILDYSKLNAERMLLNPVDFDLRACLEETILPFAAQARDKDLRLVLDVAGTVPRFVHGDDNRLRQILVNLIGNALKFTETGGVSVHVSAGPGACDCPENGGACEELCIAVRDTGIGIEADKLELVFQKFSQAETDTTRRFGGTGLGLTISRKLAEIMEGRITVASEPGAGSCFCLHVPLVAASTAAAEFRAPPDMTGLRGKTVLLAEDNGMNQMLIRKYLKDVPVTLVIAGNGEEAVDLAGLHEPDLILMDMSMPRKSGVEATLEIRAQGGARPVIVALTANSVVQERERCLAAGMDGFLTKPIRRAEFLAALVTNLAPEQSAQQAASG
jgi:PAS domain S-box-containing protein